ncbi:DNA polymerase III subunit alpha, partial [Bacteriovoracaceae bacterium]|nr:DNA polymerase III subunit alpha [Bacteriovoracaceae bacterium]
HYLTREDAMAQEVLLCIQTGKTFSDEKRMKMTSSEFYFKSALEMRNAFSYFPEACNNTLLIADKCDLILDWKDSSGNQIYHLPDFPIVTEETADQYFARMAREGLQTRFQGQHFKKLVKNENWERENKGIYLKQLENEIDMITQMGFSGYFLIVSDFILWAKEKGIAVGPGRGSGVGSLVAYALNITNINPIPFNLLFERFINPERISMPDFDVDFCQDRRSEVINYVTEKYGSDKVGQIITFGKLQAKAVIRDVSRVFDLPYSEADMLAKLIPDELGISLENAIKKEPKFQELRDKDPKIRQILKISKRLEGLFRHASIHAAGVIITNKPLVNYCPLFKGKEGEQVVQFDKDFSEQIGLVKFDFLGLKTLTVIDNAIKFIKRDVEPNIDIEAIDLNDPQIYSFISSGRTTGVFQLESSGMKDLCKRVSPDSLEDITAVNALYRPGPLGSGMVDDFIEIKHGRKEMSFPFPELEPILKDTYGIIVYQEQVMNIARIVAGYSLGQADILRRAMGKKKMDVMTQHRKIFEEGAIKRGYDAQKAVDLFDLMAKFAEYGFNKSHAVAYALIAYQTAFLKFYYPASFYAALLTTELSNTDKVTNYIKDAKDSGIDTLPPDINESIWQFNVIKNNIRYGLGAIKNVGEGAVQELIRERTKNGPFQGFVDFCERVSLKFINKRVLESMVKVGVFDNTEKMNRKTLLSNLEKIISYASKIQEEKNNGQGNLFSMLNDSENNQGRDTLLDIEISTDFEQKEKLNYEKELMGIYVSGHPLERYQDVMAQLSSMSISDAHTVQGKDRREVSLSGLVNTTKNLLTKKGDRMAFASLEDFTGKIECVIFPKVFAQYEDFLNSDEPVIIYGEINLLEDPRKFFPKKFTLLKEQADDKVTGIRINVDLQKMNKYSLPKLKEILIEHRGVIPAQIVFSSPKGKARFPLGENFLVSASPKMASRINELFQTNCVKFLISNSNIPA